MKLTTSNKLFLLVAFTFIGSILAGAVGFMLGDNPGKMSEDSSPTTSASLESSEPPDTAQYAEPPPQIPSGENEQQALRARINPLDFYDMQRKQIAIQIDRLQHDRRMTNQEDGVTVESLRQMEKDGRFSI